MMVVVKRIGDIYGYVQVEWIWSDFFYWKSYDLVYEWCMYWYESELNLNIFIGREDVLFYEI